MCPSCGAEYGESVLFCPRDGSPLASRKPGGAGDPYLALSIGDGVEIERLVGMGTMGRVYRARQAGVDRPVAVKILHREHAKNTTFVARFQREGRVAASLQHPNVVSVLWSGELPRNAARTDGEPYLVMEYLDGLSLRSALVAASGKLPLLRALRIVLQIADAMGEAHARGIVHRDLKPENVMLVTCGADPEFVKVLDFGVARVGEADSSIATHAGAVLGTATYACPESARGDLVGPPGDVYALATVLFECLAGKPPFVGKSAVDVLIAHARANAPVLDGEGIPEPVARVVSRNLAKNPLDRASTAREFGRELFRATEECRIDPSRLANRATLLGTEDEQKSAEAKAPGTERRTLRNLGTAGGRPS